MGIDEVGRGPMAGPLVVAGVILPHYIEIEGLNDSKKVSEKKRELLYDIIKEKAIAYYVHFVSEEEVDRLNIYQATKKAMEDIINIIDIKPDYLLIDAMKIDCDIPRESIIKGDSKSLSIAAASILAKVERDRFMIELAKEYPEYGFERHKGYPTKEHKEVLNKYGVTKVHRKSYKPVADKLNDQLKLDLFENK